MTQIIMIILVLAFLVWALVFNNTIRTIINSTIDNLFGFFR